MASKKGQSLTVFDPVRKKFHADENRGVSSAQRARDDPFLRAGGSSSKSRSSSSKKKDKPKKKGIIEREKLAQDTQIRREGYLNNIEKELIDEGKLDEAILGTAN